MKFSNLLAPAQGIAIGGHRGCGENLLTAKDIAQAVEPAVRENTIASFKRAAEMGVSFVEFDVQVTRDGVPVIWHDDQIITRRPGVPPSHTAVKDHSLSDFTSLVQQLDGSTWTTEVVRTFRNRETRKATDSLTPWQCQQDDKLPTLQQVFQELPEHVGFDIEVKMTVPDDILATPPEEIARVVEPIVKVVEECTAGSSRTIMFSSFDPDVCVRLRQIQNKYPVMFLSGCGLYPHVDPRRTSISAALQFAAQQDLAGVVLPVSVLMANPELMASAKANGLKVLTYGLENDDVYTVEQQMQLGVHAAIVDNVEATLPRLLANQEAH